MVLSCSSDHGHLQSLLLFSGHVSKREIAAGTKHAARMSKRHGKRLKNTLKLSCAAGMEPQPQPGHTQHWLGKHNGFVGEERGSEPEERARSSLLGSAELPALRTWCDGVRGSGHAPAQSAAWTPQLHLQPVPHSWIMHQSLLQALRADTAASLQLHRRVFRGRELNRIKR